LLVEAGEEIFIRAKAISMIAKLRVQSMLRAVLGGRTKKLPGASAGQADESKEDEGTVAQVLEDPPTATVHCVSEEAQRCLAILKADRARCRELPPQRVDSLAEKRGLVPADRLWLYQELGIGREEEASDEIKLDDDVEHTSEIGANSEEGESGQRSDDPVQLLLKSVQSYKLLSAEEERTLGRQVRNGAIMREALRAGSVENDASVGEAIARGDAAHQRMVLSNIRLVVSIARKYVGWSSLDLPDLVQEGVVGLMKGIEKYDPELGNKLSTYASWWIRQSITRGIYDTGKTIRFPVHVAEKVAKLRKVERRLIAAHGTPPSLAKLANALGWPIEQTEEMHAHSRMSYAHIDEEPDEDAGRPPLVLVDTAASPHDLLEMREMQRIVRDVVSALPEREREIIERRFGLDRRSDEGETLAEIGDDQGVTRERIRQIEAKALRRIRHPKRVKRLLPYRLERQPEDE
jgi:RNA polymerase primary sigma factor